MTKHTFALSIPYETGFVVIRYFITDIRHQTRIRGINYHMDGANLKLTPYSDIYNLQLKLKKMRAYVSLTFKIMRTVGEADDGRL